MNSVISRLETLAPYSGPWRPLRDETTLLRARVRELREREERLDGMLVVALVGGSGVGKSTLLNALAGDQLAPTSEYRPCTSSPTVYQPPGSSFGLDGWTRIYGSALEHLIVIDTPDSDTVVKQHRESVIGALGQADVVLVCGSPEKYLDEATWSLLRPLQGERSMVCVETKADTGSEPVREHWLGRMREQGFNVTQYFRVSPRRTLDRKLTGRSATENEFDFPRLESFLHHELNADHAQRIKRSNAYGLLTKTLGTLNERVASRSSELDALTKLIDERDKAVAREVCDNLSGRIFAEPHLWNFALGREIGLRAKGIVGTSYRALEAIRTLPARAANWFSLGARFTAGKQAAALLSEQPLFAEEIDIASDAIRSTYANHHSHVGLAFSQAGFDLAHDGAGFARFADGVQTRLAELLRGPARDRIVGRARLLTSWPMTFLADAPPVAFMGYAAYRIVDDYFAGVVLPGNYFVHAGAVLAILLAVELFLMSLAARLFAWSARRSATRALRTALLAGGYAFIPERSALAEALQSISDVHTMAREVTGA
ncbi:MAG: GTPase domain-containing protein [Candidatus Hydrogenedentes bacterium]|nr:GTPase domain-containing protein [Candidatus Hydrogenedentota bacterium]